MKSQSRCGELKTGQPSFGNIRNRAQAGVPFFRKEADRCIRYAENESQTREDKHFTFVKSGIILEMNQDKSEHLRYFFILNRLAKRFDGENIKYRGGQTEGGIKDGIHSSCTEPLLV